MNMKSIFWGIISSIVLSTGCSHLNVYEKHEQPVIIVADFVYKAPILDGNLDEKSWRNANWQEKFNVFKKDEKSSDTQAAVLFDDTFLYVAFKCAHTLPEKMKMKKCQHDGAVGSNESVELLLDGGTSGQTYMHFVLDAANQHYEKIIKNAEMSSDISWSPSWHSAIKIDKKAWTVEIAIPLYIIARNGGLDGLRMNLARNQRNRKSKNGYSSKYFTLAPVKKSFHETYNFLTVKGLKSAKLPFIPTIDKAVTGPYYTKNGKYFCDVTVFLRSHTSKSGNIRLKVIDFPEVGKSSFLQKTLALAKYDKKKFTFPFQIKQLGTRKLVVEILEVGKNKTLQSMDVKNCESLDLLSFYLKQNYYTGEKDTTLICRLGLPEKELQNWGILLKSPNGKILFAQNGNLKARMTMKFSLETLHEGKNKLSLFVLDSFGKLVRKKKLELLKLKPSKGSEVKIDRVSRVLLKDGKPFFPICLSIQSTDEKFLELAGEDKFNTVFLWKHRKKITMIKEYFSNAGAMGLSVIAAPNGFSAKSFRNIIISLMKENKYGPVYLEYQKKIFDIVKDRVFESVRSMKYFKPLLAYNTMMPCNGFYPELQFYALKKAFKEIDPYHPDFAILSNNFAFDQDMIRHADIIGIDPMWHKMRSKYKRSVIKETAKIIIANSIYAKKYRKPVFALPLSPFYVSIHQKVRPDFKAEYFKAVCFASIIHGAGGIFYCADSSMWKKMGKEKYRELINETASAINKLLPFITQAEPKTMVKYNGSILVPTGNMPEIMVSLRRNLNGDYLLMLINASEEKTLKAELKIPGLQGKAEEIYSKKSLKIINSAFTDSIKPLGCKAYRIEILPKSNKMIAVTVNFPVKK